MSMNRHVKVNVSFEAARRQKISAREQKIAFLNSLSADEIDALNKSAQGQMKKIVSAFEGYEV